jgi:hypothetical protein
MVHVDHTFPPTLLLNAVTNLYENSSVSKSDRGPGNEALVTASSWTRLFHPMPRHPRPVQNSSFPPAPAAIGLPAELLICTAPSFCSRLMYVLLVVFQASMYFSMQEERQVCSFEEREVEGLGIQVAKQFLGFRCQF